jgi:hypothetical protein
MGRVFLILAVAIAVIGIGAGRWWWNSQSPATSSEVVQLTPEKRHVLEALRAEHKFQPNDYPPLGYTGMATPEDERTATDAVNSVIDKILATPNGPRSASEMSDQIGEATKKVDYLETEDRERTAGYLIEIWYILGFKGSTGRFAYGAGFPLPPGYGEPLPPGWKSPTEPRVIG